MCSPPSTRTSFRQSVPSSAIKSPKLWAARTGTVSALPALATGSAGEEGPVRDRKLEVLADLVPVDDLAGAGADPPGVGRSQRSARPLGHRPDLLELSPGRNQQLRAPPLALGGNRGVAAADEPLARERLGADLGQVSLVEEGQLQIAGPGELADLGGLQRADELDPGLGQHLGVGCCQYATVADHDHVFGPEVSADHLDRARQGPLVGDVPAWTPIASASGGRI